MFLQRACDVVLEKTGSIFKKSDLQPTFPTSLPCRDGPFQITAHASSLQLAAFLFSRRLLVERNTSSTRNIDKVDGVEAVHYRY